MALKMDDFLSRRIRWLLLDAKICIEIAPKVAKIMAAELKKDKVWIKQEVQRFNDIAKNYLL